MACNRKLSFAAAVVMLSVFSVSRERPDQEGRCLLDVVMDYRPPRKIFNFRLLVPGDGQTSWCTKYGSTSTSIGGYPLVKFDYSGVLVVAAVAMEIAPLGSSGFREMTDTVQCTSNEFNLEGKILLHMWIVAHQ